jgi:hypothetical protein
MMNIKPVNLETNNTWKDRLTELFWPVVRIYRKLARSLAWAIFAWDNYDWDHAYLLEMIVFKMKRMQVACFKEGHHIPEKLPQQSLRLCIKLGEKLVKDDYFYFSGLHNQKWGELEFITKTDETGRKYTGMGRSKVPPGQEEQERAEAMEAYRKDDAVRTRDSRWFYSIMQKYQESWWD